jgi:hypothetical protein
MGFTGLSSGNTPLMHIRLHDCTVHIVHTLILAYLTTRLAQCVKQHAYAFPAVCTLLEQKQYFPQS